MCIFGDYLLISLNYEMGNYRNVSVGAEDFLPLQ